jgi:hypothetical protein
MIGEHVFDYKRGNYLFDGKTGLACGPADLPGSQCAAYRTGKASHFVELDPNGKLIRTG